MREERGEERGGKRRGERRMRGELARLAKNVGKMFKDHRNGRYNLIGGTHTLSLSHTHTHTHTKGYSDHSLLTGLNIESRE